MMKNGSAVIKLQTFFVLKNEFDFTFNT